MQQAKGFTLIELMIVVAVIAILAAIALPAYNEQVRKGRRAEAARFAGEMQLNLERWRAENPSYADCVGVGCGSGTYPASPDATTSPFYTVAIDAATATGTYYIITAAPRTGSAQAGDRCGNLTLERTVNQGTPKWATVACN